MHWVWLMATWATRSGPIVFAALVTDAFSGQMTDITPLIRGFYEFDRTLSAHSLKYWLGYYDCDPAASLYMIWIRDGIACHVVLDLDAGETADGTPLRFGDVSLSSLPFSPCCKDILCPDDGTSSECDTDSTDSEEFESLDSLLDRLGPISSTAEMQKGGE